jgi:hypothetical protein
MLALDLSVTVLSDLMSEKYLAPTSALKSSDLMSEMKLVPMLALKSSVYTLEKRCHLASSEFELLARPLG